MYKDPYHPFPGMGAKAEEKEQRLSVPWDTIFRQLPQLREELESGVPTWSAGGSQCLKPALVENKRLVISPCCSRQEFSKDTSRQTVSLFACEQQGFLAQLRAGSILTSAYLL